LRGCPHNPISVQNIQEIHEATTVYDIARNIPRISAALEDRQAEHQSTMIEIEGIISNQRVYVLIDPRASISYIGP